MNDSNSNNDLFNNDGNINNIQPQQTPINDNNVYINSKANASNNTINTVSEINTNFNSPQNNFLLPSSNQPQINQNIVDSQTQMNANSINETNTINSQSSNSLNTVIDPSSIAQSTNPPNPSLNNNNLSQLNINTNNQDNNDELLRAFIGNNYEKITTKKFNFAGFFFTSFYMLYRKMFVRAIFVFLINLVILNYTNNFFVTIVYYFVIGLSVNKSYLAFANDKIANIKIENTQKSTEEIKKICSIKGGTSVFCLIFGILAKFVIGFVVLIAMSIFAIGGFFSNILNIDNWNITLNGNDNDDASSTEKGTLIEDVNVSEGYACYGSKCYISVWKSNVSTDYVISNNSDLFTKLGRYKKYIKVNIYYVQKGEEKTIVDYKIFLKSNNKDISNVKSEDELRNILGLYSSGIHTDILTLSKIGLMGYGYKDGESFNYIDYTFVDGKNIEYNMTYKNPKDNLNLVKGKKYIVTFEVEEYIMSYEFTIKSIEPIN